MFQNVPQLPGCSSVYSDFSRCAQIGDDALDLGDCEVVAMPFSDGVPKRLQPSGECFRIYTVDFREVF